MASIPITSWQIDGETMEIVTDFISLGSKITTDGNCSHEIKRHLPFGRKGVTKGKLDSILKSTDITLPRKVHVIKTMFFSSIYVWLWELDHKEGWALRTDAFELLCWRRLLRVPWTAKRSEQSILKEISPEYSLEGLMLNLKLRYFGHLMQRADSLEKTQMLKWLKARGKGNGRGEMVGWHHPLNGYEFEQSPGDGERQEAWGAAVHGVTKNRTWLSDWTTTTCKGMKLE